MPRTGRLAALGDPLSFVIDLLAPRLSEVGNAGRRPLRFATRDSRSEPGRARQAVRELVERDRADVVITMAGTKVLPAVADACEALGVPCISTTFPWQAYVYSRAGDMGHRFDWTYHFAWGLDDIATVFADIWESFGDASAVGCLWNDDLQGRLLRHDRHGFAPAAASRGHTLIDPGGYREPAADFGPQIEDLRRHAVTIVTSAATATDLALFHRQAREAGCLPRLITCSRWLAYPHTSSRGGARNIADMEHELAEARVATLVYWTPGHPHRSSLDGITTGELAAAYQDCTGNLWLQPLGLAHALVEVAHHALAHADAPTDRRAVAQAIGSTRLDTIAGHLDWTSGPTPNIALIPLIGGQWQPTHHGHQLAVVTNTACPDVPVTADVTPTR
ncbi:ABC transporter substrate-binding protein [Actinomadura rudentiformis]|uniref:ABC transporter substrate-binding protein n=1 Tax=Actinomadura rudentiformis TaxID=359158 RepID=UPI0021F49858|nr:ABC transporter substrate-binding protein [Actinomadura rudentiformis]